MRNLTGALETLRRNPGAAYGRLKGMTAHLGKTRQIRTWKGLEPKPNLADAAAKNCGRVFSLLTFARAGCSA